MLVQIIETHRDGSKYMYHANSGSRRMWASTAFHNKMDKITQSIKGNKNWANRKYNWYDDNSDMTSLAFIGITKVSRKGVLGAYFELTDNGFGGYNYTMRNTRTIREVA